MAVDLFPQVRWVDSEVVGPNADHSSAQSAKDIERTAIGGIFDQDDVARRNCQILWMG